MKNWVKPWPVCEKSDETTDKFTRSSIFHDDGTANATLLSFGERRAGKVSTMLGDAFRPSFGEVEIGRN